MNARPGVAVVTGAAGGIGSEVARALAATGTAVALLDADVERVTAVADTLAAEGASTLGLGVDVRDSGSVERALDTVEERLGEVDQLVNAAGILHSAEVTELTDDQWDDILGVNAGGVFRVSRAVARRMVPRGRGAVVTVASNSARTPRTTMSAYAASKAAAAMFTKCLGLELARHGIRCNVVDPGSTRTPMLTGMYADGVAERASVEGVAENHRLGIPLGKVATPADIAAAVLFLLSEQAGHITLHELTVDGGATLGA